MPPPSLALYTTNRREESEDALATVQEQLRLLREGEPKLAAIERDLAAIAANLDEVTVADRVVDAAKEAQEKLRDRVAQMRSWTIVGPHLEAKAVKHAAAAASWSRLEERLRIEANWVTAAIAQGWSTREQIERYLETDCPCPKVLLDQLLGMCLFPLVQIVVPHLAGKITGSLLLDMDTADVLDLIDFQTSGLRDLKAMIKEGVSALIKHGVAEDFSEAQLQELQEVAALKDTSFSVDEKRRVTEYMNHAIDSECAQSQLVVDAAERERDVERERQAKAERADREHRHDELMREQGALERAREAERKQRAEAERAQREANPQGKAKYVVPKGPAMPKPGVDRSAVRTTEEEIDHAIYTSEPARLQRNLHGIRSQVAAASEADERREAKKAAALRQKEAERSACGEASTHSVPAAPTLDRIVNEAKCNKAEKKKKKKKREKACR